MGLLAVRARSRRELRDRLRRAGFDPGEVDEELERLERVGLVDDAAFARQLAEHAFGPGGRGARAVAAALSAKGIEPGLAAATVSALAGDEEARAVDLARSRAPRLVGLEPRRAFERLCGLLLRRGYDPETARTAARQALEVDPGAA